MSIVFWSIGSIESGLGGVCTALINQKEIVEKKQTLAAVQSFQKTSVPQINSIYLVN